MIDIKSLFEKFSNANFFSRVDNISDLMRKVGKPLNSVGNSLPGRYPVPQQSK